MLKPDTLKSEQQNKALVTINSLTILLCVRVRPKLNFLYLNTEIP